MICNTLFNMKIKQGINSYFIHSKKGWGFVLFDLSGLVSIIYMIMQGYFYSEETSIILLLAFIILLGYSYLSAEKYLYCIENRFDLLTGSQAHEIIWAIYGQVFVSNFKAVSLFPLIIAALSQTISPWLIPLTFLVFPFAAAVAACSFNIVINRYCKRIAAAFYLFFMFLWGGGTAAILGFLLANHNLSFATLDNRITLLIIIALSAAVITIMLFSANLSGLWKEAFLLRHSMHKRLSFIRFKQLCRLASNCFVVKEWVLLWRNPVTKIRFIVWAVLIIICSFTALKSYLYDPTLFLIIVLAIWLFNYGEMPATAWQNEGEQKSFYWLGGIKPAGLIIAKIATFLPLAVIGILTSLFLGLAINLSFSVILQKAGVIFLIILAAIVISIAIASLGHKRSQQIITDPILEAVPLTTSGILAVGVEFLFCCIGFLPLQWILILSLTIPLICLIGQAMWLGRIYYST